MKIKSWDAHSINDGTNYEAIIDDASWYMLPDVSAVAAERTGRWPVLAGVQRKARKLYFTVYIRAIASRATLQTQLASWFDPEDETPKKLICEDAAGGNDRYIYGICEELKEVAFSAGVQYIVGIRVHGDPRWRENTATTSSWNITATGQTKVLANGGEDDAYPILTISPTSAKTGGYAYRRWMPVRWLTDVAYTRYPVDICNNGFDTDALVTAGKMQADGDDLRVWMDGVEVDRWLDGINTTTTQVWINMTFLPKAEATLGVAIASTGAITTITASTDISDFPNTGVVVIDSEAFYYTGKNAGTKKFTGVTRAAKGTSMAAHTTTDEIWWVQHDVWILYGNSSATAPTTDDDYKPMFNLTSTNASWDYDSFYERGVSRSGAWSFASDKDVQIYGGNQGASGNPYAETGIYNYSNEFGRSGKWEFYNPCQIVSASFANAQKYCNQAVLDDGAWNAIADSRTEENSGVDYEITEPSTAATWEAATISPTLIAAAVYVSLHLSVGYTGEVPYAAYIECSDVTLGIVNYPTITIGSELSNYRLVAVITNNTTGDAIGVTFDMSLNEDLEVDTDAKTIVYLDDNSSQFQALDLQGDVRRDWLPLQVGNNTIQFDDTGTNAVTIDFEWSERHYD